MMIHWTYLFLAMVPGFYIGLYIGRRIREKEHQKANRVLYEMQKIMADRYSAGYDPLKDIPPEQLAEMKPRLHKDCRNCGYDGDYCQAPSLCINYELWIPKPQDQ